MSVMAFRERRGRREASINVTSLIDVLFLFIIFFMLTGTFKRVGELELRLPDSTTATAPDASERAHDVELIATEDGRLLLDGVPVERWDLKRDLEAIRARDPDSRLTIKAESAVSHGEVVILLDIVRGAGFPGVGIGTHRTPPSEPSAP